MNLFKQILRKNTLVLLTFSSLVSCQESFDNRLYREAKEFTINHCPQEPEKGTRLDSTTYDIASRTYTQWYGLATLNEQVITENIPLLKEALISRLMADVNFKALKDENVTFRYVYYSQQNGKIIYQTLITAKEYK